MSLEMTSILPRPKKTADLTTFGGRLHHAMEKRGASSAGLAQVLVRQGFSVNRINIDQWCRINENTWKGESNLGTNGKWKVVKKGTGLKDSRSPYPMELQLIVIHLRINGMWLMVGGDIPMERGGGLPETREDMEEIWDTDPDTRLLLNHVLKMNKQARKSLIDFLAATNQVDYLDIHNNEQK